MVRFLSAFLVLVSGPALLHAAQPYSLSKEIDLPMGAGLLAMKYNSGIMLAQTRAMPRDLSSLHRSQIPAMDRWAIGFYSPQLSALSSVVAGVEFLVPAAVNLMDTYHGEQPWQGAIVDAVILQEALMLSSALSSYSKSIPMHSTPLTYDSDVPDEVKRAPQNASSFFSNHTTSAFTTAVFSAYTFQLRHPDSELVPWVWGGGLALATGVGSMRVLAGKHFPSDVLAGAAVGAFCGYLVPKLHTRRPSIQNGKNGPEGKADPRSWDMGVSMPEGTSAVGPALFVRF
ncbi:MAG: phosphoesterase PA-phosphatase [Fibrobacteres bacterium]|nr:phosphoesterase PA-phosphatase [Fibrobacterota bacterium]